MGSSTTAESDSCDHAAGADPHHGSTRKTAYLINRQRTVAADCEQVETFLAQLASQVATSSFSVCLLSDRNMRRYNQRFRSKDCATDVLSFPASENLLGENGYLGDILISVETARENAARYGLALDQEIKILALHGLLHLMGYDHERDQGRMARTEKRWCAKLGLPRGLTDRHSKPVRSLERQSDLSLPGSLKPKARKAARFSQRPEIRKR